MGRLPGRKAIAVRPDAHFQTLSSHGGLRFLCTVRHGQPATVLQHLETAEPSIRVPDDKEQGVTLWRPLNLAITSKSGGSCKRAFDARIRALAGRLL